MMAKNVPRPDPAAASEPPAARRRAVAWERRYARLLVVTDVIIIVAVLALFDVTVLRGATLNWPSGPTVSYWIVLVIIGALWLLSLTMFETRDRHIVGHDAAEYRRIIGATIFVYTVAVSVAFFLRIDASRALFILVLPFGLLLLLASRWLWRQWLRGRRREGTYVFRTVLLGERAKVEHIARQIRRSPGSGYVVVGAITPSGTPAMIGDVPVLGSLPDTARAIEECGADTLILGGSDDVDPNVMRRLGWAMADRDVNWVVAPALTDVAGPRIHSRPVAGLPLVHVDFPRMEGYRRFAKRAFDLAASLVALPFALVIMGAAMVAIRLEGPGPLIYSQQRVGRGGNTFTVYKLRSMIHGADDQLAELLEKQGKRDTPFHKIDDDPRITVVGRFIRRHSIDELPQLFNVISGKMSLVGPRPQRPKEVELYDDGVKRRLLVKPGLSGLWQVSGRSKLSAEDAIRFDLYYVENWSFAQDMLILLRTAKAVFAPGSTAH